MRENKGLIGWLILFFIGLAVFIYPTVSDKWNQHRSDQLVSDYKQIVNNLKTESFEEEKNLAYEYNQKLLGGTVPDVFAVREDMRDQEYESLLNPKGDGMMGYVEIPAIDVHLPVYHYTSDEVLQENVGHLFGSSLPIGGPGSHSAMSAHRGLPSAKLFSDLNLLEDGDFFLLHVFDETLVYEVDQILVVEPHETESLSVYPEKDYSTLFTCTPYGVNTQRLLVRGHRIIPTPEEEVINQAVQETHKKPNTVHFLSQVGSVVLGVSFAAIIITIINRLEKKKAKDGKED